jgi:hypothetical protein
MRRTRPVALMRLVITVRDGPAVYVSSVVRAYGDDPYQNYTIARMLWAVRNSPGFSTLQPFVVFHMPQNRLAWSMFALGARSMRLRNFAEQVAPDYGGTLRMDELNAEIAATNRPLAGRGAPALRLANQTFPSSQQLPPTVQGAVGKPWNETWVHPSLGPEARKRLDDATRLFRE